jgi:hypothetical protein
MKKKIDYLYAALKWHDDDIDRLSCLARIIQKIGGDENYIFSLCVGCTEVVEWNQNYMDYIMDTIDRAMRDSGEELYTEWFTKNFWDKSDITHARFNNCVDELPRLGRIKWYPYVKGIAMKKYYESA